MATQVLPPVEVLKAIDIYLSVAYTVTPPAAVRARLEALRALPPEQFYVSPVFERDRPIDPTRLALRLGNRFYPHMKLMVEQTPDQRGFLLRADTHDAHCRPKEGTREYGIFCELMEKNQQVAQAIEAAWAGHDLPTFKTWLRDDLKRRMAAAPPAHAPAPTLAEPE